VYKAYGGIYYYKKLLVYVVKRSDEMTMVEAFENLVSFWV
jgi:hypothetical protein